jgi:hypothetical protein
VEANATRDQTRPFLLVILILIMIFPAIVIAKKSSDRSD